MTALRGEAAGDGEAGVAGTSEKFNGVLGVTRAAAHAGVAGVNEHGGNGTYGRGHNGLFGHGTGAGGSGVVGSSDAGDGVVGITKSPGKAGVIGASDDEGEHPGPGVLGRSRGTGVWGASTTWVGVYGRTESTTTGAGVLGEAAGTGVFGKSSTWYGVYGESSGTGESGSAAVCGEHKANGAGVIGRSVGGTGVFAKSQSGLAGHFDGRVKVEGDVEVAGDVRLLGGDVAELFDVAEVDTVEPGTLMVMGDDGRLVAGGEGYDTRVIGVIAGAGEFRPGLLLDAGRSAAGCPVAMVGKAYCKVDAAYGPISAGDLLTTSATPGHAMRVSDHVRATGAVVGKALAALDSGRGLIPMVVTLR